MRLAAVLLVALLGALLLPGAAGAARVEVREGVVYGEGRVAEGRARLLLDLHLPAQRARRPRPVVIAIHGGGFVGGSRADPRIARVAQALAARGVVVASIQYRLQGQGPVPSARVAPLVDVLPAVGLRPAIAAAVDDTLTAVRYLRAQRRRLGLDLGRLGLVGSSAGAITAGHVAYALDDVGVAGPRVRFVGSLWGGLLAAPGAELLDRGEARLFAAHGDADATVPVALSDALVARARGQGVRREYHRVPGGTHGFDGTAFFTREVRAGQTAFDRLLRFAARALR